ncbi:MAG: hypothetical protein JST49_06790 [Bacteroidetes bacterium]|nr:hypothetical protein [Bacteroidota bacterium]
MRYLYILSLTDKYQNPANWTDETNATVGAHWNYLVDLHSKDIVEVVGRTNYEPGNPGLMGLSVFKADSLQEAEVIMNNDPCIVNGVMTAQLHPFNLFMVPGAMVQN